MTIKERPILFSAPMVRAILEGTKTQTRRIVADVPDETTRVARIALMPPRATGETVEWKAMPSFAHVRCAYGETGDRLWVRETHAQFHVGNRSGTAPQCVAYRATCDSEGGFDYVNNGDEIMHLKVTKWTPAIHMPRWASRIKLEITGVRVERLLDITKEDARSEGVVVDVPVFQDGTQVTGTPTAGADFSISNFRRLWDSINAKRAPWSSNPWVWVVSFKRVQS